jgi:hypothetical protein
MSPIALISLIALVVGAVLVILALIAWQEARRRPSYEPLEYVVDDAVKHVTDRLPGGTGLRPADVRRILEWEVFYLQGLAQEDRRNPVETVAGGHEASVDYISEQIRLKHGISYPRAEIEDVLRLEADYLSAIGAIGEPVTFGEEE